MKQYFLAKCLGWRDNTERAELREEEKGEGKAGDLHTCSSNIGMCNSLQRKLTEMEAILHGTVAMANK